MVLGLIVDVGGLGSVINNRSGVIMGVLIPPAKPARRNRLCLSFFPDYKVAIDATVALSFRRYALN